MDFVRAERRISRVPGLWDHVVLSEQKSSRNVGMSMPQGQQTLTAVVILFLL